MKFRPVLNNVKYVLLLALIIGLYGCAHARLMKMMEAQGETLHSYKRSGGDEIHIVKSPDNIIRKYRVYPYKTNLLQVVPNWRYEQLYAVDTKLNVCFSGTSSIEIDCEKLTSDPDLSKYITK